MNKDIGKKIKYYPVGIWKEPVTGIVEDSFSYDGHTYYKVGMDWVCDTNCSIETEIPEGIIS